MRCLATGMLMLAAAGVRAAVTARLPDDYWRTLQDGEKRGYHCAAEEVAYFAAHRTAAQQ